MRRLGLAAVIVTLGMTGGLVSGCSSADPVPMQSPSSDPRTVEPTSVEPTEDEPTEDEPVEEDPADDGPATPVLGTFAPLSECPDLTEIGFTEEHFADMTCGYLRDDLLVGLTQASDPVSEFRPVNEDDEALAVIDYPQFGPDAFASVPVEGSAPETVAMYGCSFYLSTTDDGTLAVWSVPAGDAVMSPDELCSGALPVVEALLMPPG